MVGVWTAAWARSRSAAPPEPMFGGWYVHVGLLEQKARYVFAALDPDQLGALAERIDEPGVFLKVCAPVERVRPVLPQRWEAGLSRYFMAVPASAMKHLRSLPAGYKCTLRSEPWGLLAAVTDEHGAFAAQGRLIFEQGWGVFDRIETDEAHRRRGLGRAVMHGLQAQVLKVGVRGGLLVATVAGQRLYESLGWTTLSDYTSMTIPPPSAASC